MILHFCVSLSQLKSLMCSQHSTIICFVLTTAPAELGLTTKYIMLNCKVYRAARRMPMCFCWSTIKQQQLPGCETWLWLHLKANNRERICLHTVPIMSVTDKWASTLPRCTQTDRLSIFQAHWVNRPYQRSESDTCCCLVQSTSIPPKLSFTTTNKNYRDTTEQVITRKAGAEICINYTK